MNKKTKTIIWVGVFVLVIAGAVLAYNMISKNAPPQNNVAENSPVAESAEKQQAVDFTITDSSGASVKLSDYFGKPIVLNFWASWCPPCKSEMPEFNKVWQEMGTDVVFMMVDMTDGQRETIESAAKYISEQGFGFPVYFDTSQQGAYAYAVNSIPATFFIDKDGYIVQHANGAIDEQTLRAGIDLIKN